MTAPYTRSMASLHWFDAASHLLPGPADGKRWIVRDIVITNLGGNSNSYSVFLRTGSEDLHLYRGPVPAQESVHLELRQVLDFGETLGTYAFSDGQQTLLITGYELDL